MSHDIVLDDRNFYNATRTNTTTNTVTWQSAFWPLITCALAVMLQNTGRVCGAHFRESYAFRSSPLVCIVDTLYMIVKFFSMITIGCSFKVAAMHVWYDRFEHEANGCQDSFELFSHICSSERSRRGLAGVSIRADDALDQKFDENEWLPQAQAEIQRCGTEMKSSPVHNSTVGSSTDGETQSRVKVDMVDDQREMNSRNFCVRTTDRDIEMGLAGSVSLGELPSSATTKSSTVYPGSGIDRTWRLNMVGFIFGTLPQAIKIFGMRGIPLTQTLVAFFLISFLVPEAFRAVAGPAGAVDLQPMPIISETKAAFARHQIRGLLTVCWAGWLLCYGYLVINIPYIDQIVPQKPLGVLLPSPMLAAFSNILLTAVVFLLAKLTLKALTLLILKADSSEQKGRWLEVKLLKFRTLVYDLFAFDHSLPGILLLYVIFLPVVIVGFHIFMEFWASQVWVADWGGSGAFAAFVPFSLPFQLAANYVIFRLVFVGSLSSYPRWLFGIEGRFSEFVSWTVVMINFLFILIGYTYHENFSYNTVKPRWAEYLG